jgi:hypothetical protein
MLQRQAGRISESKHKAQETLFVARSFVVMKEEER